MSVSINKQHYWMATSTLVCPNGAYVDVALIDMFMNDN